MATGQLIDWWLGGQLMTRGLLLTRSVPDVGKVIALDCRVRMRSMRQLAPFPRLKGSPAARWRFSRVQGRGWRVTGRVW